MVPDGKAALFGTMYITVFALPEPGERRQVKVGSITVPAPALYPLSRDRAVTYLATRCPGHAAFAVRAARSRVAQCHPERGWLRSAARPHSNSFAAAAAATFA